MAKFKKLLRDKEMDEEASELMRITMDITKMHLKKLQEKAKSDTLNSQESFALCGYLKTLSYIEKAKKEERKDFAKSVNKMSDEELEEELRKHAGLLKGVMDELDD